MRLVFTGGGTGGHVLPNIAVIEKVKGTENKKQGLEIFYIGGKTGPESELCEAHGIQFFGISCGKFRRYFSFENFADFFRFLRGFFEAFAILRRMRPTLVFSKGGYVSVPVVLAARALAIPLWIHEADVSPGLATRLAARCAAKIFLSFEESKKFFPGRPIEVVGNPIRSSVLLGESAKGFALTGFTPEWPVVLVMGGSSGARWLNEALRAILPELLKEAQVVHITGPLLLPPRSSSGYKVFSFAGEELAHLYAIADLAVSRAGSGSIFELAACRIPMLLVPLPLASSRGDQIENARVFERRGLAAVFDQEAGTPADLLRAICMQLKDSAAHKRARALADDSMPLNGAATIARQMENFIV